MKLRRMLKYTRFNKPPSRRRSRPAGNFDWRKSPDIKKRVVKLASDLNLDWLKTSQIYCIRSSNSKTRARARIWGLSRIWQKTLSIKPAYIIEVISERFDNLSQKEQDEILLHELVHIPRNFSGSLLPHIRRGKGSFYDKVEILIAQYLRKNKF